MGKVLKGWTERYIERVELVTEERLLRQRISRELTQEMLRRSRDQIAISHDLLSREVPKVWHPESPQKKRFAVGPAPVRLNSEEWSGQKSP